MNSNFANVLRNAIKITTTLGNKVALEQELEREIEKMDKIQDVSKLRQGTKVHYIPFKDCDDTLIENGMIKSFSDNTTTVFVVFNCGGDWKNFTNYTGASTKIDDLRLGWYMPTVDQSAADDYLDMLDDRY